MNRQRAGRVCVGMIALHQEACAGRLGTKGIRSWFLFVRGVPAGGDPAFGYIEGPWSSAGIADKGAAVTKARHGWLIEWMTRDGYLLQVRVRTFSDVMRVAKAGPEKMTSTVLKALAVLDDELGVDCHNAGTTA